MKKYLLLAIVFLGGVSAKAQTCPGVGINATTAASTEYDAMISGFHSTIIKKPDGSFWVWGENTASNGTDDLLSPQKIDNINYPTLTGTVLKAGIGGVEGPSQHIVLTTQGMFAWGTESIVLDNPITTSTAFNPVTLSGNANGLPTGVSPTDVKTLFVSYRNIAILTNAGAVYVLTQIGANRGVGSSSVSATTKSTWGQVKTNATTFLENIVAVRGCQLGFIAIKADGTVWTWGNQVYLGNGTAYASENYATQMTIPAGITPKMVGATISNDPDITDASGALVSSEVFTSYYVLGTNGSLYAIGNNEYRQLGDFTTTQRNSWIQVKKTNAANDFFTNVAYISPNEHDGGNPAVSFLTTAGQLYVFGKNDASMLGVAGTSTDPTMPTGIATTDVVALAETGGHTTAIVKLGSDRYCYVGHKIAGSMGDGTSGDSNVNTFDCINTPIVSICGASCLASTAPTLSATTIANTCPATTVNLRSLVSSNPPATGVELRFYTVATSPVIGDSLSSTNAYGTASTVYAYYYDTINGCISAASSAITVSMSACGGCPTVAAPVVADGSRCDTGPTIATISTACVAGTSLKIFSDAALTTDVSSSFTIATGTLTSPSISTTTTYYAACQHDTQTTCKSTADSFVLTINSSPSTTASTSRATCTGSTANSDGKITLTGFTSEKYDYNTGTTYMGALVTYFTATLIPSDGIIASNLSNPASTQTYTVRIFNASGCFIDRTVTLNNTNCSSPCGTPSCAGINITIH